MKWPDVIRKVFRPGLSNEEKAKQRLRAAQAKQAMAKAVQNLNATTANMSRLPLPSTPGE